MAQTRSFRIFVSSTFRDFDRERDTLRRVEIALRERLVPFGATVTLVDLRWGVQVAAAEGQREAEILQVCLDEVARTRPLFIGLLGDRYGWVPDEEIAERATARRPLGRSVAGRSVTELEIEYGVLTEDLVAGNAAFFFRTMSPGPPVGFAEDPASAPAQALAALKQRVRDAAVAVVDYEVDVSTDGGYVTDEFERAATETIWGLLAPQLERPTVDPSTLVHEGFASELASIFVDPDDRITRIRARLDAVPETVHVVTGAPGSGRSSTLAALAHRYRADGGRAFFHSVPLERAGEGSAPDRFVRFAGLEEGRSTRDAVHALDDGSGPVLVCLDGIDRSARPSERAVSWLPDPLPPGIRVVVSCDSWPDYASRGVEVAVIDDLFPEAAVRAMILGRFARLSKSVPAAVVDELVNRAAVGGPLWTSVATDLLAGLDVVDFARVDRGAVDPQAALADLLVDVARGLSPLLSELYEELFQRARRQASADAVEAVSRAVTYTVAGAPTREAGAIASALAGRVIDDLELARVRWALRGQIASHGSTGWLSPAHDALRRSVAGSTFGHEAEVRSVIARALAPLRATSPFAASEFLAQCLWLTSGGGLALALEDAVAVDRAGDAVWARRMLATHLGAAPVGARLIEAVLAEPGLSVAGAWVVRGAVRDALEDGLGGAERGGLVDALLVGVATRAGAAPPGTDSIAWHDLWAAVVYDRAYWLRVPDDEWIMALEQATGAWRALVDLASEPAAVAVRLAHAETDLARALAATDVESASSLLARTEAALAALDLERLPAFASDGADVNSSRVAVVRALASVDDARMFLAASTSAKRQHLRAQIRRLWSLVDAVNTVAEPGERHRSTIDDIYDDLARASMLLVDHSGSAGGASALSNLDRALDAVGAALRDAPSTMVLVRAMGRLHRSRAELLVRLEDPSGGVAAAQHARRMFGVVAAISPDEPDALIDMIRANATAGEMEAHHGDRIVGLGLLHDAVALALELLDPDLGSATATDAASQYLVVTTVLRALDAMAVLGSEEDGYGASQLFAAGAGLMTLIDESDHLAAWERERFHAELALVRAERLSRDSDHGRALTDLAYAIGVADELVAVGVADGRRFRSRAYARASDCAERRADRSSAAMYLRAAIDELDLLGEESEDPAIESQREALVTRWWEHGY